MDDRLFRDFVHIGAHLVVYSLLIWQLVLGFWLIIRWINKNWKIKVRNQSPEFIGQPIQPVINIEKSSIEDSKKNKNMGPIEVDVKKNMIMDTKSDESSVKLDEKIKGKVKTQKDKLRDLRK